jgi:hypothetical protein
LFGWSVGKVKVSTGSTCQVAAGCGVCSVSERFKKVGFGRSSAVFAWLLSLLASQIWVLPKSEFVVKCSQNSRGSGLWSRSLAQPENA